MIEERFKKICRINNFDNGSRNASVGVLYEDKHSGLMLAAFGRVCFDLVTEGNVVKEFFPRYLNKVKIAASLPPAPGDLGENELSEKLRDSKAVWESAAVEDFVAHLDSCCRAKGVYFRDDRINFMRVQYVHSTYFFRPDRT